MQSTTYNLTQLLLWTSQPHTPVLFPFSLLWLTSLFWCLPGHLHSDLGEARAENKSIAQVNGRAFRGKDTWSSSQTCQGILKENSCLHVPGSWINIGPTPAPAWQQQGRFALVSHGTTFPVQRWGLNSQLCSSLQQPLSPHRNQPSHSQHTRIKEKQDSNPLQIQITPVSTSYSLVCFKLHLPTELFLLHSAPFAQTDLVLQDSSQKHSCFSTFFICLC